MMVRYGRSHMYSVMNSSMPKIAKELSALEISRLREPDKYAVGGVTGLYLYVTDTGARSWVLRTTIAKKRRHMGLGAYPSVSLAQAREAARKAKAEILAGTDPIDERQKLAAKLHEEKFKQITFEQSAVAYIEAHGKSWKNEKHRAQWSSTLITYAFPKIGKLAVKDVTQSHVLSILEPIWAEKNETASRLRGRIEAVLDWATVKKYREGENPALWKGRLDKLLPAPNKVQKKNHHKALSINEIPHFFKKLKEKEGISPKALEFTILTAARSGEVRGAQWSEIDIKKAVWTIPASRMKAGSEHREPLSDQAIKILKSMPRIDGSEYVFPSSKGGALSDMALLTVMRRMSVDAVPHGFRSTFRDWAGECTNYPREVAEQALAHTLQNKVEAAYRRGDSLDKRRKMMQEWADFCSTGTL